MEPSRRRFVLVGMAVLCFLASPGRGRLLTAAPDTAQQLGTVSFPNSCSAGVQQTILTGLALLHSFQYTQAQQSFAEAAKRDARCPAAYWGRAMALFQQIWDEPSDADLKQGLDYLEQAQTIDGNEHERQYITAARAFFQNSFNLSIGDRLGAYSAAMAELYARNPQDAEAGAFYALSLVALAEQGHDETANRNKAIAVLEPLVSEHPAHPGAVHYLIHAADTPELAPKALEAARRYAQIAPDSSHALHMPSHIFVRLGLWQESVASNLAASAAAAKAIELHLGERSYQLHAMDFLNYSYLQIGAEAKARGVVKELKNIKSVSRDEELSDHGALFAARIALELHRWKEASCLSLSPAGRRTTYWARAIGAARNGDARSARKNVVKLKQSSGPDEKDHKANEGAAVPLEEAEAWLAYSEGRTAEAVRRLAAAADEQERQGLDSLELPAREMLGDLLVELNRPAEALEVYRTVLKETPKRFNSLYAAARAAQSVGDSRTAKEYFTELTLIAVPDADRPEVHEARVYLSAASSANLPKSGDRIGNREVRRR
jgi:hypothetical protein